jgi:ABC-type phosphate transport system ATPase subunit
MICLLFTFFEIASARGDRGLIALKQTAASDKITFAVIGDTGTGEKDQFAVAQRMEKVYEQEPFGFVLMLGDNIYGSVNSRPFKSGSSNPITT